MRRRTENHYVQDSKHPFVLCGDLKEARCLSTYLNKIKDFTMCEAGFWPQDLKLFLKVV